MSKDETNAATHHDTAWSCKDCGHIMAQTSETPPTGKCPQCKAAPAHWLSAEVTNEPVDAGVAASADYSRDEISGNDPAGPIATSPAGVDGGSINPELRVRY